MSLKIDNKIVLESAITVAKIEGFMNMTRLSIAQHAKVSDAKVSNAFGSMIQLKRAVMRQAIHRKIYSIIMDGIVIKDPTALKISAELKSEVIQASIT